MHALACLHVAHTQLAALRTTWVTLGPTALQVLGMGRDVAILSGMFAVMPAWSAVAGVTSGACSALARPLWKALGAAH